MHQLLEDIKDPSGHEVWRVTIDVLRRPGDAEPATWQWSTQFPSVIVSATPTVVPDDDAQFLLDAVAQLTLRLDELKNASHTERCRYGIDIHQRLGVMVTDEIPALTSTYRDRVLLAATTLTDRLLIEVFDLDPSRKKTS
jgi:hypothetical protein